MTFDELLKLQQSSDDPNYEQDPNMSIPPDQSMSPTASMPPNPAQLMSQAQPDAVPASAMTDEQKIAQLLARNQALSSGQNQVPPPIQGKDATSSQEPMMDLMRSGQTLPPARDLTSSKDKENVAPNVVSKASDAVDNAGNRRAQLEAMMKAYGDAQSASNLNRLGAGLNTGIQQALAAAGRRPADYEGSKELMAGANAPVEDLQSKLKMQDAISKLQQNEEISDPNSKTSKLAQGIMSKYTGVDPKNLDGVSAENVLKMLPVGVRAGVMEEISKQRAETTKATQAAKGEQQKTAADTKAANQYTKDITKARQDKVELDNAVQNYDAATQRNGVNELAAFRSAVGSAKNGGRLQDLSKTLKSSNTLWGNLENKGNEILGSGKRLSDDAQWKAIGDQLHAKQAEANDEFNKVQGAAANKSGLAPDKVSAITPGGTPSTTASAAPKAGKVLTKDLLSDYAKKHDMDEDSAQKFLESQGYALQ